MNNSRLNFHDADVTESESNSDHEHLFPFSNVNHDEFINLVSGLPESTTFDFLDE